MLPTRILSHRTLLTGLLTTSALALAACDNGGSSSSGTTPEPRFNFVNFDDAEDGTEQKARIEVRTVDADDPDALDGDSRFGTAIFELDGEAPTRVEVRGTGINGTGGVGNNNAAFDEAGGFSFAEADSNGVIVASSGSSDNTLRLADPNADGRNWNYQTFGIWERVNDGDRRIGVLSAGAETAAGAVPAGGSPTAQYNGEMIGWRQSSAGAGSGMVGADVRLDTDFSSISLQTTGTETIADDGSRAAAPQLDLNGTGSVSGSRYSGNLTGSASGDFTGRFYGPGAEEAGGTLRAVAGSETITGSFGARR